jgi:hypothetical protein
MRRLGGLFLLFAVSAALSACGSSGASTTTSTTAAGGGSSTTNAAKLLDARLAAAKCMRAQGINMPDPTAQRGTALHMLAVLDSYPPVKAKAAQQACKAELDQAFPNANSLTPAERTQRLRELEVFATCMRSHGINYPDPASYAGDPSGYAKALASVEQNSPAFKTTGKTCKALALKNAGG